MFHMLCSQLSLLTNKAEVLGSFEAMKILELFIASVMANLKVLLLTAVGAVLALERVGIMGEEARKHMNIVSFFVFYPALIAANLAKTITFKSMIMLWFMPFNILISFIVGSILGWILLKIIKVTHILRRLVLGCCAAGNLGNMLLSIIPAVCKEKGSPFGAADVCNAHGLAYASLSLAIGNIYLWLYVYNMERVAASQRSGTVDCVEEPTTNGAESAPASPENSATKPSNNAPLPPSEDNIDQLELGFKPGEPLAMVTVSQKPKASKLIAKIVLRIKDIAVKYLNLKTLFAPSTVGAIVGLVIGAVAPFKKIMIGETAPLRFIENSTSLLGDAAVPTITLVMGSNLPKGLRRSDLKLSLLVSIIVVRYIFLPVIGAVVVKAAVHFGLVTRDPLYQFVLLLQFTTPPNINISTITQLFGVGEKECSVIFLSTYALAPVALTLWSTLFLWLVR